MNIFKLADKRRKNLRALAKRLNRENVVLYDTVTALEDNSNTDFEVIEKFLTN